MSANQICAFCKHFQEPLGLYDQNCRCELSGKFTKEDNTCVDFVHMYSEDDDFYHDLNDEGDCYD